MIHSVKCYVYAWEVCQQWRITNMPSTGLFAAVCKHDLPDWWFSDYRGPFQRAREGFKYLNMAVDNISWYALAISVKSTSATDTAKLLIDVCEVSPPKYLTFDQWSTDISQNLWEVDNHRWNKRRPSTACYPQSKALAQRMMEYIAKNGS